LSARSQLIAYAILAFDPLHPVILAEDRVDRLEARTAFLLLVAEPAVQQEAVVAGPDAQQGWRWRWRRGRTRNRRWRRWRRDRTREGGFPVTDLFNRVRLRVNNITKGAPSFCATVSAIRRPVAAVGCNDAYHPDNLGLEPVE
jgi:hypothetical protein